MSTTIDQRVVEMRFDNKQFESNVTTTMSTLDKLKKSLHLDGASKGLEEVNSTAKRVDMSGLGNAVETVRTKFSALQIMGVTALSNITNSAVNAGKRIASALTIDPVKTGFNEYETKINAIQTIMSNTASKGTTMEDVTRVIGELNTYADKTIYNFAEMTRNIGTFTAAGIGLEESASAIQGIANLAAASGSSSQQASTAMYQLSQALSTGTVRLMDWNSVVNAGMGGEKFQEALKATAKEHGVAVDSIIKKSGSFRDSLQEGWLSADILNETLRKFTVEGAKEYAQSMVESGKYTQEQADALIEEAQAMEDAATKVKTFTQLWDTLKESAQSGWSQTWEIIVGDFEEAKETLTKFSEVIGGMISASADARNELLQGWKDAGGRADLIDSLFNVFNGIMSIIKPIKEAFREIFPPITVEQLVGFTKGLKELTEKFKLSDSASNNLKRTFKGLFAILDIVRQVVAAAVKGFLSLFSGVDKVGGGILEVTATFGDWIVKLNESIKSSDIFNKVFQGIADILRAVLKVATNFIGFIKDKFALPGWELFSSLLEKIQTGMSGVGEVAGGMKGLVVSAFEAIGSALERCSLVNLLEGIWNLIKTIGSGLAKVFGSLTSGLIDAIGNANFDGVLGIVNSLVSGGILVSIIKFIKGFATPLEDLKELAGGFLGNITGILDGVKGSLESFQQSLQAETLKKIAIAIAILAAALIALSFVDSERLYTATGAITMLFAELLTAMSVSSKITTNNGLVKIGVAMISLSSALLILAAAMKIISTMSLEEMGVGLLGIAAGLAVLVAAVNLLPEKKVKSAASAIKKMSTALVILAVALKIMSTMSWEEMGIGLVTTVVGLGALVAAANLLPKDMAIKSAGILSLATALVILAAALKIMSTMSWEEMGIGLVGLAGALGALVISMRLMKNALPGAAAMIIIAPALISLAAALKIMGNMSLEEIGRGLVALGGAMLILAAGLNLMRHTLTGSAALLVAAMALTVLTPILSILGTMKWETIAKGLISIAGAFAIIGIAGWALTPIIPSILALATAMALIGVGLLAAGAGLTAFGVGLSALAVGFTAIVASLGAVATGIIGIIEAIIVGIGEGIIAFCEVIAEGAPVIGKAVKAVVLSLCDVLVECGPVIADSLLQLISALLDSLATYTPQIVDSLFQFVIGVLNGLADNIPAFIQAAVDILGSIFEGIISALRSMDTDTMIKSLAGIGLMAGIMGALAALSSVIPQAMVGALGLGAVIAELAIVLAAVGALAQIPGLDWLISEGGNFLQTIGTAIGQFIGGIAGGIAQGFTDSLPQIGSDLSTFMTNLQPFIDGVSLIDESVVSGVKSLVGMILAITAANLIESVASWVTGGSSITQFAAELPILGQGLKGFSDAVVGISPENIAAAVEAAKALAEMTAIIPNEGGIISWFAGENSISKFGSELPILGQGLKGFSDAVMGILPENIIAAAAAAKALAEMTSTLPNEGGMLAWFTGENSISKFANDIIALGFGLKGFSDSVIGILPENIILAANAAKALAEMTAHIPNEGGVVAWFTGETSISRFANELPALGMGLKGFSDSVAGIMPENVIAAANAAKTLAQMASVIPSEGGVAAWFTGESSISKFGSDLVALGKGLKGFSDSTAGINTETMTAAANAAKALAEMTTHIPNEGGVVAWFTGESSIANFASKLPTLGKGLKGFSDSTAGINTETMTAAANAAKALAEMTTHIPKEGGIKAWFTGETSIANFASKLPTLGAGLKGFSKSVEGINPENVTAAASAAKSLAQMTETVPKNTSKIIDFGDNLKKFGASLATYFTNTKGITSDSISGTTSAVNSVKDITSIDSGKILSISKAIDKMVESLKKLASVPKDCVSSVSKAMGELGKTSTEAFVEAFDSLDSELKKIAQEAINSFISGIKGGQSKATSAFENIVEACADAIGAKSSSFRSAGKDLVQGLADGISANSYKAEAKAKAMAKAAARAAEKALDINSPSKVFYGIGEYTGEGFVNGLDAYGAASYDAGSAIADSARVGLVNAISKISDFLNGDFDIQPTIRPVLDLSNIKSGAGSIGDILGLGSSVGVLANVRGISSMMNRQNGTNDDVVSAINKLRKDLGDIKSETYHINGITYDDGSGLADAVKSIVRAAKVERRV